MQYWAQGLPMRTCLNTLLADNKNLPELQTVAAKTVSCNWVMWKKNEVQWKVDTVEPRYKEPGYNQTLL